MYQVFNTRTNKRIFKNEFFWSYDEARQAVRSHIRKLLKQGKVMRLGMWDSVSRNPTSVKDYGFLIKRA